MNIFTPQQWYYLYLYNSKQNNIQPKKKKLTTKTVHGHNATRLHQKSCAFIYLCVQTSKYIPNKNETKNKTRNYYLNITIEWKKIDIFYF